MANNRKNALSISRAENFSAWYQAVITEADLAENSSVRGCMVIKPYGFAIWERMQKILDDKFKELGHVNCYFPMFIPVSLFEKEAEHVAGFSKEIAIVTHHRLEQKDGKLVPASPLETPLAVRPTSELVIGESMARWAKSYRDLPILINQWCNVVRWEMRTRMFLRTTEFLWQEGHTAHETKEEAEIEAKTMHEVYRWFIQDVLKMHAIPGRKPDHERFPGAVDTYTIESMMQDGKALQAATSHYLGQNFAKAVNIQFQGRDGNMQFAHTTSWGLSTRIVGGMIMSHSDDDGLNLPSEVAPYHIVLIPLIKDEDSKQSIIEYCSKIKNSLPKNIRVFIDMKEIPAQNKKWDYIRKGVPFVCEIGNKEVAENSVFFIKRAQDLKKEKISLNEFIASIDKMLYEHDSTLEQKCIKNYNENSTVVKSFEELKEFFSKNTGFVKAKWLPSNANLELLDELAVSIRCIPLKQDDSSGKCILTGEETNIDAIFAKSY